MLVSMEARFSLISLPVSRTGAWSSRSRSVCSSGSFHPCKMPRACVKIPCSRERSSITSVNQISIFRSPYVVRFNFDPGLNKFIFTLLRNNPRLVSFLLGTALFLYCFLALVSFPHGTVFGENIINVPQ